MSFLTSITSAAAGGVWKMAAVVLAVALVASSAFLGYQWYDAAADRATAVTERAHAEDARDQAIDERGQLTAHVANQNASLKLLEDRTLIAQAQYATAMELFGPLKGKIDALAKGLAAQAPSTTCQQALAKQRQAIDGLRAVPK